MQSLSITIYKSPEEAPDYNMAEEFRAATLKKAVIVRNGTEGNRSTIDLIFEDKEGNPYVAMITARLIKNLMVAVGDEA